MVAVDGILVGCDALPEGAVKPYRPRDADLHAILIDLHSEGKTLAQIAALYGGTPNGVRSNLRRLRERGVI